MRTSKPKHHKNLQEREREQQQQQQRQKKDWNISLLLDAGI
jgi:hypothetical protein